VLADGGGGAPRAQLTWTVDWVSWGAVESACAVADQPSPPWPAGVGGSLQRWAGWLAGCWLARWLGRPENQSR